MTEKLKPCPFCGSKAPDESLKTKTKPAISAGRAEVSSTKHTISKQKLQRRYGK